MTAEDDNEQNDEEKNTSASTAHTTSPSGFKPKEEKKNPESTQEIEQHVENEEPSENQPLVPSITTDENNGMKADEEKAIKYLVNTDREPCTAEWCRNFKYVFVIIICLVIFLNVITLIMTIVNHNQIKLPKLPPSRPVTLPPPPKTPPPPHFQHAFFHLKTNGYTELDKETDLEWTKDERQDEGNIRLLNGTYIFISQGGMYRISCTIQLHIPKDTPGKIITLVLNRKNNGKSLVLAKKSSSSLKMPEYSTFQITLEYKFYSKDTIFWQMNMAKLISSNTVSSYFFISSFHHR